MMLDELSIDNLAGVTGGSRQDLFAMMMMSQMQSTVSLLAAKTNNDASMLGLLSQVFSAMHGGAPVAPAAPPG
ncbi:MAG TPA: hypothetical protein VN651_19430, partial [Gemmatimonadaceae bacterium]|nr:hypothetical protein [Gemmatimonadaceae bacterium]